MGEQSKIQWTKNTWNPWHGCKKVSEGCKFCYMYRDKERYGQDPTTVMRSKTNFKAPLKWGDPTLIFTCSWSDWFIEEADAWRPEAWEIIRATSQHTYQILTKRPERILQCLPADWGDGYANVWLGVSAENQRAADERIPILNNVPAKVRFLSCEPLLGPVHLIKLDDEAMTLIEPIVIKDAGRTVDTPDCPSEGYDNSYPAIDWVIVGGESGNDNGKYRYRACEIEWIEKIVSECYNFDIPVFVKQLGTHLAKTLGLKDHHGGDIKEWPKHLQIRQMPAHGELAKII